jgi:hypothetical protein
MPASDSIYIADREQKTEGGKQKAEFRPLISDF